MRRLLLGDKCKNGHVLDEKNGVWRMIKGRPSLRCKSCDLAATNRYYYEHGGRLKALDRAKRKWDCDPTQREKARASKRRQYERDSLKFKMLSRLGKAKYKEWYTAYRLRPSVRLYSNISRSIRTALRLRKQGRRWELIVGYTVDDLMRQLGSKFVDGMSWDNYGEWEIDHIKPKSLFDATDAGIAEAWALDNLQPLWMSANRSKHAKWSDAA